ncbi:MAG: ABC transporter ATP-binding protein, partial [Nitrospina sp.]|nr:ABC transporter ATP-binding protein [Nitrospina sp.]
TSPNFILLDEPFAGIDPIAIADIKSIITHLKSKNIGILITDHNAREMLSIVDRTYIINSGNIISEGLPEEILLNKKARQIYLGEQFTL